MNCWTDGDLRAYVDRELPAADRDRLSAHMLECGGCESRYREIEQRAGRVAGALDALAAGIAPSRTIPARKPLVEARPARLWPRWAAAVAMAAGLALALVTPGVKPPALPTLAAGKGEFVALDNEPIDAGLVVRVSLGPDNVQADVIVTADGRARAYRLVNNQATN